MRNSSGMKRLALQAGWLWAGVLIWSGAGRAYDGDARRGAALIQDQGCTHCHSIAGQGGNSAPDLGSRIARQYTPASMASVMWNHAPAMWSAMGSQGITVPQIDRAGAEDLFLYLYSVRFFEQPGEVERGKKILESRHCGDCHSLKGGGGGPGKPISEWTNVTDPIALAQQMWNHSSNMKEAVKKKKYNWILLSGQDLTDIALYVRKGPAASQALPDIRMGGAAEGAKLFQEKGCSGCHKGSRALDRLLSNQSLTDIAADMWNHAPRMTGVTPLSLDEMRALLGYVWEQQYLGTPGEARRGSTLFQKKHCSDCHDAAGSDVPRLDASKKPYTPTGMVAALWKHGPAMLDRMKSKQIPWPRLSPSDMADLIAYLNSRT